jgi:hypothetical protein
MRGATAVPMLAKRPGGAARAGRSAFLPGGSSAVDRRTGAAQAGITFALAGLLTVSTAVVIRGDANGSALHALRPRSASTAGGGWSAAVPFTSGAVTTSTPTPSASPTTATPTASQHSTAPVPVRRRAVPVAQPPRTPSPTSPAAKPVAAPTASPIAPETLPSPMIPPPAETPSPTAQSAEPAQPAQPSQPIPDSRPLASAGLSAAPGTPAGIVVRVAATPQPQADITVGSTQVIGDAPPSHTTGASVGGTLVPEASAAVSASAFT